MEPGHNHRLPAAGDTAPAQDPTVGRGAPDNEEQGSVCNSGNPPSVCQSWALIPFDATHNPFALRERRYTLRGMPEILLQQHYKEDGAGLGSFSWDGAYVLSHFLSLEGKGYWEGKKVLELGCGLGLPSIALGLMGAKVVGTDSDASALAQTEQNRKTYARARPLVPPAGNAPDADVAFTPLRWGNGEDHATALGLLGLQPGHHPDALVMADVIYGYAPEHVANFDALLRSILALA
eukprot:gene4777-4945_t